MDKATLRDDTVRGLLARLDEVPGDWQTMGVLADRLEELGEPTAAGWREIAAAERAPLPARHYGPNGYYWFWEEWDGGPDVGWPAEAVGYAAFALLRAIGSSHHKAGYPSPSAALLDLARVATILLARAASAPPPEPPVS